MTHHLTASDQLSLSFEPVEPAQNNRKSFAELVQERASHILNGEEIKALSQLYQQAERELDHNEYYDPETDTYKRDMTRYEALNVQADKEARLLARLLWISVQEIITMTFDY